MGRSHPNFPKTYVACQSFLDGKNRRKVTSITETYVEQNANGTISVVYRGTTVVLHHPTGITTVNTGGWYSKTTKERINDFCQAGVWQEKGTWFIKAPECDAVPFVDGFTFENDKG